MSTILLQGCPAKATGIRLDYLNCKSLSYLSTMLFNSGDILCYINRSVTENDTEND
mgnify:CR=1 FL=1